MTAHHEYVRKKRLTSEKHLGFSSVGEKNRAHQLFKQIYSAKCVCQRFQGPLLPLYWNNLRKPLTGCFRLQEMLPDYKPVNNLSFTSIFSFFPHFPSTYTFFPPWNSVVYDLLKWLISELTHWVTQKAFVGGFGETESSSLADNLPCGNWEGIWFTNAAERAETEVPEVGEHLGSLEVSQ